MKKITIISAYNEEAILGAAIKRNSKYFGEIFVINDGRTYRTVEAAKNVSAKVIDNIVNRGLGKTIQRGFD